MQSENMMCITICEIESKGWVWSSCKDWYGRERGHEGINPGGPDASM